jgi:CDP-diglyceride synthetase
MFHYSRWGDLLLGGLMVTFTGYASTLLLWITDEGIAKAWWFHLICIAFGGAMSWIGLLLNSWFKHYLELRKEKIADSIEVGRPCVDC